MMDILLLGAYMALALVFAVADFNKLVDRPGSEKSLADFGISLTLPDQSRLPYRWPTTVL